MTPFSPTSLRTNSVNIQFERQQSLSTSTNSNSNSSSSSTGTNSNNAGSGRNSFDRMLQRGLNYNLALQDDQNRDSDSMNKTNSTQPSKYNSVNSNTARAEGGRGIRSTLNPTTSTNSQTLFNSKSAPNLAQRYKDQSSTSNSPFPTLKPIMNNTLGISNDGGKIGFGLNPNSSNSSNNFGVTKKLGFSSLFSSSSSSNSKNSKKNKSIPTPLVSLGLGFDLDPFSSSNTNSNQRNGSSSSIKISTPTTATSINNRSQMMQSQQKSKTLGRVDQSYFSVPPTSATGNYKLYSATQSIFSESTNGNYNQSGDTTPKISSTSPVSSRFNFSLITGNHNKNNSFSHNNHSKNSSKSLEQDEMNSYPTHSPFLPSSIRIPSTPPPFNVGFDKADNRNNYEEENFPITRNNFGKNNFSNNSFDNSNGGSRSGTPIIQIRRPSIPDENIDYTKNKFKGNNNNSRRTRQIPSTGSSFQEELNPLSLSGESSFDLDRNLGVKGNGNELDPTLPVAVVEGNLVVVGREAEGEGEFSSSTLNEYKTSDSFPWRTEVNELRTPTSTLRSRSNSFNSIRINSQIGSGGTNNNTKFQLQEIPGYKQKNLSFISTPDNSTPNSLSISVAAFPPSNSTFTNKFEEIKTEDNSISRKSYFSSTTRDSVVSDKDEEVEEEYIMTDSEDTSHNSPFQYLNEITSTPTTTGSSEPLHSNSDGVDSPSSGRERKVGGLKSLRLINSTSCLKSFSKFDSTGSNNLNNQNQDSDSGNSTIQNNSTLNYRPQSDPNQYSTQTSKLFREGQIRIEEKGKFSSSFETSHSLTLDTGNERTKSIGIQTEAVIFSSANTSTPASLVVNYLNSTIASSLSNYESESEVEKPSSLADLKSMLGTSSNTSTIVQLLEKNEALIIEIKRLRKVVGVLIGLEGKEEV